MNNFQSWWLFCQSPSRDGLADDTDASDGAGTTRWGFTFPTWQDARKYQRFADTSRGTFLQLAQEQAAGLAQGYFWHRLGGDSLPTGSDVSFVDFCWTSGGATRVVQERLGVTPDGAFGPETLRAISAQSPVAFVQELDTWRREYYDELGLGPIDPGDYRRSQDVLGLAMGLIKEGKQVG